MEENNIEIESHPWEPFVPANARVLVMGTFPPQPKRWAMDFYYPNRTNDFWPMMGLIFFGDREALRLPGTKDFDVVAIKRLLNEKGIALNDTGRRVRRLMGNASDKFLEIVEPVPLYDVLALMPLCKAVATTGEHVIATDGLDIWRMPSTSRAFPMKLEAKAEYYARLFRSVGIL